MIFHIYTPKLFLFGQEGLIVSIFISQHCTCFHYISNSHFSPNMLSMPVDGIDADEETSSNFFTSLPITAN